MSQRVFIQFVTGDMAPDYGDQRIRKWSTKPFEGGVEYERAAYPDGTKVAISFCSIQSNVAMNAFAKISNGAVDISSGMTSTVVMKGVDFDKLCDVVVSASKAAPTPVPDYTEGVCGDGAAILRDGQPMTISEILVALNRPSGTTEGSEAYEPVVSEASAALADLDQQLRNADHNDHIMVTELYNAAVSDYTVAKQALDERQALIDEITPAERDVLAERQRQQKIEGFNAAHDDAYRNDELSRAAICYALGGAGMGDFWPWPIEWWKPTDRRRDLVKAGALIIAEIERLDRAAAKPEGE